MSLGDVESPAHRLLCTSSMEEMQRPHGSRRVRVAGTIAALVLALGHGARAQPTGAQAEALFRQGKELMASGKIAEACAAFDMSQKLDPTVTTLLNQANCREKNGQLATAWGLFLEAARQTSVASDAVGQRMHAVAADRAAKLEPRLSTLRIDVPRDSQIGGLEVLRDRDVLDPVTWNKALPSDGGTYQISARAPGNAEWSSTVVVAPERDARTIEIPRLRPAALGRAQPDTKHASEPSDLTSGPTIPSEPRTLWSTNRKLALGAAGGTVLAVAVGSVLGVSAKNKQHDAQTLCPDLQVGCKDADRANELIRSGHGLAIGADVAFGVGAAAAIAAGVLWFTGAPESPGGLTVVPAASSEQVLITVNRSF